jgi:hypothetical protein
MQTARGARAYVTAEADGTHKFLGRVIRVGRLLGENIRTDEPPEHVDTKVSRDAGGAALRTTTAPQVAGG